MHRRHFLSILPAAAATWPFAAHAQERMRRVGVLMLTDSDEPESQTNIAASYRDCTKQAGPSAATCGSTTAGAGWTAPVCIGTRRN